MKGEQALWPLNAVEWRLRRGMLELDVLLQCYFERYYEISGIEQKRCFQNLLQLSDDLLYRVLVKNNLDALDPVFYELVTNIKSSAI